MRHTLSAALFLLLTPAAAPAQTSAPPSPVVVAGAGVELGDNWLLGPEQNVSVGTGFALTRIGGSGHSFSAPPVLPDFRLTVGIAF